MAAVIPQTKTPGPGETGVFLIDKPSGISSHHVVNQVRRLTNIKRVGHAGTLDPLASGLLIVLVGREYTKLQQRFLKLDKEYLCTARLGVTTDTYDTTGEIINRASASELASIVQKDVERALAEFSGTMSQTVPPYSAVKRAGRKLYELAREGTLEKQTLPQRTVTIKKLALVSVHVDQNQEIFEITFRTIVSSGTYIRSLAHDLGKKLGIGATVSQLRRTQVGEWSVDNAVKLPETKKRSGRS